MKENKTNRRKLEETSNCKINIKEKEQEEQRMNRAIKNLQRSTNWNDKEQQTKQESIRRTNNAETQQHN